MIGVKLKVKYRTRMRDGGGSGREEDRQSSCSIAVGEPRDDAGGPSTVRAPHH